MKHDIEDKSSLKKYRTEIPNIVFHLGLSPYDLALYCHMKRAAGGAKDGRCTKSGRRLAAESNMSHPMMLKAKWNLAAPFELLRNRPLISLTEPEHGKRQFIGINDIWDENTAYMLHLKTGKPYDHFFAEVVNDMTTVVNEVTTSGKPRDRHLKKEPKQERTKEEIAADLKSDPRYVTLNVESELVKMDAWLSEHKGRGFSKRFAVNWLETSLRNAPPPERKVSDPAYQAELEERWKNQPRAQRA